MIERIQRYMSEEIKERFIDGLRPKHKKPVFKKKKSPAKKKAATKDKKVVKKKTAKKKK